MVTLTRKTVVNFPRNQVVTLPRNEVVSLGGISIMGGCVEGISNSDLELIDSYFDIVTIIFTQNVGYGISIRKAV